MRREVIEAVGLLSEDMRFCLDLEYWVRCSIKGVRLIHLSRLQGVMRFHGASKSMTWDEIRAEEQQIILERYFDERGDASLVRRLIDSVRNKTIFRMNRFVRKPLFRRRHAVPASIHEC